MPRRVLGATQHPQPAVCVPIGGAHPHMTQCTQQNLFCTWMEKLEGILGAAIEFNILSNELLTKTSAHGTSPPIGKPGFPETVSELQLVSIKSHL